MFYYLFIAVFTISFFVELLSMGFLIRGNFGSYNTKDRYFFSCMVGLVFSIFSLIPTLALWYNYADDISKVCAQQPRIDVYEDRIDSLTQRLNDFEYPGKPKVSFDADTPWAAMVISLTTAEEQLAKARDEKATAIRALDKWKRGPYSGVVVVVGDDC